MDDHCEGDLILHRDGTVALCTLELFSFECAERTVEHHLATVLCTEALGCPCPCCDPLGPMAPERSAWTN